MDLGTIALDLKSQVRDEAVADEYWVCAPARKLGEAFVEKQRGAIAPRMSQRDLAIRYMQRLNREVAHDGAWIVAWCDVAKRPHPIIVGLDVPIFTRMVSFWKDRDGDVPFTVDTDDLLRDLLEPGAIDVLVAQAEEAWQAVFAIEREAGIGPEHKIKWAQGQRPRDARVKVPNFF